MEPRSLLLFSVCLSLVANVEARIGETPNEFAHRYGRPFHPNKHSTEASLLKDAQIRIYQKGEWRIRAAFMTIASPAVRVEYWKKDVVHLRDSDIAEILAANANGQQWKEVSYKQPGQRTSVGSLILGKAMGMRAWKRTDGTFAQAETQRLIISSPEAIALEKKFSEKPQDKRKNQRPEF